MNQPQGEGVQCEPMRFPVASGAGCPCGVEDQTTLQAQGNTQIRCVAATAVLLTDGVGKHRMRLPPPPNGSEEVIPDVPD